MWPSSLATAMWQIVLGLMQHLGATPAIIVENNKFAYYKVPLYKLDLEDVKNTNDTSRYLVLQCPPKVNDTIPKPKDMQICNVVDQYKEIWSRPKPKRRLHMIPFRIILRPLPPPMSLQLSWNYERIKRQDTAANNENALNKAFVEDQDTPLKYLGLNHRKQKLLRLDSDHSKLKRGSRTQGYQHMYHRDETYNDHIFYDELKLNGEFDNHGESIEDY